MQTIQQWDRTQDLQAQDTGQTSRTLSHWRHECVPVVTLRDLLAGLAWRQPDPEAGGVLLPPPLRAGVVLGGARLPFGPLHFDPGSGQAPVQVAQPSNHLTAGLTDDWHNIVVTSLGCMSTSHSPSLTGEHNADGDWVIDYAFDQTLPGRARPESTCVSVTVQAGTTRPSVASFTVTDSAGICLELPFRAVQFPGRNGRFEVRVPASLPQRHVLDAYLPTAPASCTLLPQPRGNTLVRFTSCVGLNQEIELDVVPDLHGVYAVCSASVLQPPLPLVVMQPHAGSGQPSQPPRFRVAANIEQALGRGLRNTYAGQQLLASNQPFTLRALILKAQADGVVPTYELSGADAWVFGLDTRLVDGRRLSFALKVRVIDLGQGEADVVDARLVNRVDDKVRWRFDHSQPNADMI